MHDSPLAQVVLQSDVLENTIHNSSTREFGGRLLYERDHSNKIQEKSTGKALKNAQKMEVEDKGYSGVEAR